MKGHKFGVMRERKEKVEYYSVVVVAVVMVTMMKVWHLHIWDQTVARERPGNRDRTEGKSGLTLKYVGYF